MASQPLVPSNWSNFPEEFSSRLGSTVGRQRVMASAPHLLIVAHMVPEHDEASRRGVLFWRDEKNEWRCSNGDPGKVAITMHLDRYAKKIEHYEAQEAAAVGADDYLPLLEGLAPIVRSTRNLLESMEEARKVDRSLIDHRDRSYDLSRQADLLYEDAKNSMDVAIVRRADEQAQATRQMTIAAHRLNMLAAMFFPFATLGAIFGTTLTDNWSWSHSAIPFATFIFIGLFVGLAMAQLIARPSKDPQSKK
jgi:hypothetical protein